MADAPQKPPGHGNFDALIRKLVKVPPAEVTCRHERTHYVDSPDEPGLQTIEVCDDCGMSRSHWEQGSSNWMLVDLPDGPIDQN
ncbi:MAG TPA: hypothetical protein VK324_04505 [Tepidisphaeraceae bacterium]|nr:hypothetical protein [Tepidisphaeraceae bacterium]